MRRSVKPSLSSPSSPARRCRPRPSAADTARYILPPGNYGGLPTTDELDRPAPALRRPHAAARQRHRRPTSTSSSCPRTSTPIGATHEEQTGRPGLQADLRRLRHPARLRQDARRRRLRRRLGDRPRPRPAAPARPRPGPRGRRRRARASTPSASSPAARSFVPERRRPRRSSTEQQRPARQDLRRQGPADPRRRPGLRRRHQRLLEGERHRPSRRPPSTT